MPRYIIFDTETTDLSAEKKAVEFALMEIDENLTSLGECSALINPERPISPEAFAVHQISDEMVANCPTIEQWIERELGGPLEGEVTLIGHRVGFDAPLFTPFGNVTRRLDTLPLAFEHAKDAPNKKLGTLKDFLGLPGGGTDHRALADVMTCHQLLGYFVEVTGRSLEELITTPFTIHYCPWGKHEGKRLLDVPRGYREWMLTLEDLDPNLRRSLEQVSLMDPPYKPLVLGQPRRAVIPVRNK